MNDLPHCGHFVVLLTAMLILIEGCAMPSANGTRASNFALTERTTIGGSGSWDFITFDPVRERLFIARGDRVQVWSSESKRVAGEIAGTGGVHGVALAQDLRRGFTSNGRTNTVTVFDLETLHVLDTISGRRWASVTARGMSL
jgi:DNA-binding beta-propeller fold protein YncE